MSAGSEYLDRTEGTARPPFGNASLASLKYPRTGRREAQPGKRSPWLVHIERAELARLNGDDTTHQRELREALRLFTEMNATGHAERLAKELGL